MEHISHSPHNTNECKQCSLDQYGNTFGSNHPMNKDYCVACIWKHWTQEYLDEDSFLEATEPDDDPYTDWEYNQYGAHQS